MPPPVDAFTSPIPSRRPDSRRAPAAREVPRPHRDRFRRSLLVSYAVSGVLLGLLSVGAVIASRQVARNQAFDDAERMTGRLAELVIAPLMVRVLVGDAAALTELERTLEVRVDEGYLIELVIWDVGGQVMFASDPTLIGIRATPPAEVLPAIRDGVSTVGFDEAPEVAGPDFTPSGNGYVEAYVPLKLGRQRLAMEAYYDYRRVNDAADALLWRMLPLVLAPLVLLQLFQLPIATMLARRVRRYEHDRSRLLEQTLSASEDERSRIAGDLHDGPIQELAGLGYLLDAVEPGVAADRRELLVDARRAVGTAMHSLRRLMADIYPPDLSGDALPAAVAQLAAGLDGLGIAVDLRIETIADLDDEIVTLLYQLARETLANVGAHSGADRVTVVLERVDSPVPARVRWSIADDGVGVDLTRLDRRAEGHLGIRLLSDRVAAVGGVLTIDASPTTGTRVTADLPRRLSDPY